MSSAERMRRTRELRREGFFGVVPVTIAPEEIAALVTRGLLDPNETRNRKAIGYAVAMLMESALAA